MSNKMLDLIGLCKDTQTIGISGHIRPDGDCVGATLALSMYLQKVFPQKQIKVFLEKPATIYNCIKGYDDIDSSYEEKDPFDVFFVVDCGKDRTGNAEVLFDSAKLKINIDHHISNKEGCGDYNYVVPEASSASELVYSLMDTTYVDEDIAKAVYIGIIHDTGVFQYSNVAPSTLRVAADLIAYGFDFPRLIDETFYEKTYVQNLIMGRALCDSELFCDGVCIVSHVDRKTMDLYNIVGKDMEGVVNQLRLTKGVDCAVFLYEYEPLTYKISMRSCGLVDVSKVAEHFAGGGHKRAAGCVIKGTYEEAMALLKPLLEAQVRNK